jgi:hypothetical protein
LQQERVQAEAGSQGKGNALLKQFLYNFAFSAEGSFF